MRKFKFLSLLTLFLMLILLTSCSMSSGSKGDYYAPGSSGGLAGGSTEGGYSSEDSSLESPGEYEPTSPDDEDSSKNQGPVAGQITAAEWNDHENYDFWCNLFKSNQENQNGLFSNYFTKLNSFNSQINTQNMITIKVLNDSKPVINLPVTIKNDTYTFNGMTNAAGIAYLFLPYETSFPYIIEYNNNSYELTDYTTNVIELSTSNIDQNTKYPLELMFVIDTTGSMGDELSYLKSEVKDVIEQIDTNNDIRLSLLFYRDNGDQYVTRFFDFTTDIDQQIVNISNQRASGGGDYEEAVDTALNLAVTQASWSENSNKILIHVLDAPPHSTKQNINLFASSILSAAEKGIRIIPVASSGIDKWTEFLLRTEALITGGTYTYITNHSGIGGDHIDATVESVVVEYLNDMLVRLINEFYTGIDSTPIPFDQIEK